MRRGDVFALFDKLINKAFANDSVGKTKQSTYTKIVINALFGFVNVCKALISHCNMLSASIVYNISEIQGYISEIFTENSLNKIPWAVCYVCVNGDR